MVCRALLCEDGLHSDTSDCVYIWVCAIWGKCLKCTIDKVLDERGVVYINPRMHAFMYSLYILLVFVPRCMFLLSLLFLVTSDVLPVFTFSKSCV